MCLILFAYNKHPVYKLIVAANRDEFYSRPTSKAHFWENYPNILGGKDLSANGTWMGVTTNGKISMLTNYRDLSKIKANAPSRGHLVSDFLKKDVKPQAYLEQIDEIADSYNGFNLIIGNQHDLWYYSNHQRKIYMLGSGIYGLSNALLDTSWPKVNRGKTKFTKILKKEPLDQEALFKSLYDDTTAEDHLLPKTGLDYKREKAVSSMFIKTEDYGTRCTTILLIDNDNNLTFIERTYNQVDFSYTTEKFQFKLEMSPQNSPSRNEY